MVNSMKKVSMKKDFDTKEEMELTVKELFKKTVLEEQNKKLYSFVLITNNAVAMVGSDDCLMEALVNLIIRMREQIPKKEIEQVIEIAMKTKSNNEENKINSIVDYIFGDAEDE